MVNNSAFSRWEWTSTGCTPLCACWPGWVTRGNAWHPPRAVSPRIMWLARFAILLIDLAWTYRCKKVQRNHTLHLIQTRVNNSHRDVFSRKTAKPPNSPNFVEQDFLWMNFVRADGRPTFCIGFSACISWYLIHLCITIVWVVHICQAKFKIYIQSFTC